MEFQEVADQQRVFQDCNQRFRRGKGKVEDCREKEDQDRRDLFRHDDAQIRVEYERRQCCTGTQKGGCVLLEGGMDSAINSP